MGIKNPVYRGYLYFVTSTVTDWLDVFTRPEYKHILLDSLRHCQKEKGLEIYSWCLMTNHLHMVAAVNEKHNHLLSDVIRDMKRHTSRAITDAIAINPSESRRDFLMDRFAFRARNDSKAYQYTFWQEGYEPKEIHTNGFLQQKIDYIHDNPVRAEIVETPESYLYSSAQDYAGMKGLLDVIIAD